MFKLAFVLTILAVGIVGAIRNRFVALLLYVWFALFRPTDWMWIDINRFRGSLMIGLLLVVPCLLTGIVPVFTHILSVGALVFLASAFAAQMHAVNQAAGWYWLDFLSKVILVSLFAVRLTSTPRRLTILIAVIAFSFGFHPVKAGLLSLLTPGAVRYFGGLGGAFADNNGYAVGIVMILPFLIATAQNAPWRWLGWASGAAVPPAVFAVISTFSRGGLLALVAASLTFFMLQRRRFILLICASICVPVLIWAMPLPSGYADRMGTIGSYAEVEDTSALSRLHFWNVALRIAADQPLGIGLWNFESNYDRYDSLNGQYGRRRALHNSHLQVLTETGWTGAAAWVLLFVSAFLLTFRARRQSLRTGDMFLFTVSNAVLTSMTAFLLGGSFVSMALNDLTWFTFAIAASLDRIARQTSSAGVPESDSLPRDTVQGTGSGWQPPERRWQTV